MKYQVDRRQELAYTLLDECSLPIYTMLTPITSSALNTSK
jgi:hypothetical protein